MNLYRIYDDYTKLNNLYRAKCKLNSNITFSIIYNQKIEMRTH